MDPYVPIVVQLSQGLYDLGNRHTPRAKLEESAQRMDTSMDILRNDGLMMDANQFDTLRTDYDNARDTRIEVETLTANTSGIFDKNIRSRAQALDKQTKELLHDVLTSSEDAKVKQLGFISAQLHTEESGLGTSNDLPIIKRTGHRKQYIPVSSFPALRQKEKEFEKFASSIRESLQSRSDVSSSLGTSAFNVEQNHGQKSPSDPRIHRDQPPLPQGYFTKVKRPSHHSYMNEAPVYPPPQDLNTLQYQSYQEGFRVAENFRDSISVGPPSTRGRISDSSLDSDAVSLEKVQSRSPQFGGPGVDGITNSMDYMTLGDQPSCPPIWPQPATAFQPPPPQFGSHIHEPYPGPRQSTYDDPRTQQWSKENTSSAHPLLRENPTNNHASGSSPLNSTYDRHETQQYGEEDESPLHPLLRRNPGENAHQPAPGHATTREGSSRDGYQRDHNDERDSYRERPSGHYADSRYEESSRAHHAAAHGHGRSSERERQEKDRYEADRDRHRRGRRTDDYSDSRRGESSRTHYGGDGRPIRDESQDRYGKSKHTSDRRERHEHRTDDHYSDEKPRYRDHDDYRDRERNRKHGGAKEERYHQPSGRERYESSSKPSYGH